MAQGQVHVDDFPTHIISGQLTGLVTGTVYSLPDKECTSLIVISHPSNAGTVWIGNVTGTANGGNGYPLSASRGNPMIFSGISNISYLKANFDSANDKLCWIAEVLD